MQKDEKSLSYYVWRKEVLNRFLLIAPSMAAYPFQHQLISALIRQRVEVHFASSTIGFAEVSIHEGVIHHQLDIPRGANLPGHIRAALQITRLINTIKPDIIDVQYSAAIFSVAIARKNNWPYTIGTFHGLRFPLMNGLAKSVMRFCETRSAKRHDMVNVLTRDDKQALNYCGVNNVQILSDYGIGCDINRFSRCNYTAGDLATLRTKYRIRTDDILLVFVGRFVAFKGFHTALLAFWIAADRLQKEGIALKLALCGASDPQHRSGLNERELKRLYSDKRIMDVGWIKAPEDLLAISDFLIFPSQREGMAVSLMEALSMGLPVITSSARGCADVVDNMNNGFIVDKTSPKSYADKIELLCRDSAFRNKLAMGAETNRNKYSRQQYVNSYLTFIHSIPGL